MIRVIYKTNGKKKINTLVKSEFEDPIKITTEKIMYEFNMQREVYFTKYTFCLFN